MADLPRESLFPLGNRFWSKVNRDGPIVQPELGPCWLWTGGTSGESGYGKYAIRRVSFRAHRLAWEEENGPVPEGLQLDHLCGMRLCVRRSHLEPVTGKENIRRVVGDFCPEGHPYVIYRGARQCPRCRRARARARRG